MKINIITTLSPSPKSKSRQKECVLSWHKFAKKIVSMNHKSEIEALNDFKITFVEPKKTGKELFGKELIPISEILNYIISENEPYFIINSDIEIAEVPQIEKEGLYIFNRYDYSEKDKPKLFNSGFDVFYVTPETAKIYKESQLCLGRCHWDYFIPYMAMKKEFPVYTIQKPFFLHKKHDLNYDFESWKKTAKIFSAETRILGSADIVSKTAYKTIYSKLIRL